MKTNNLKNGKTKRILALAGVILLVLLVIATLIFALIDTPWSYDLFRLCLGLVIIVPVLLYAYQMVARVLSRRRDDDFQNEKQKADK